MIRILHLTDFHLNRSTLKDWKDYYKDAFFEKLKLIDQERKIDLVVFSGDLLDKGGFDFKSVCNGKNFSEFGFGQFETEIIQPLLKLLGLDISRFIMCPGNHDIVRTNDNEIEEGGVAAYLKDTLKINEFISSHDKNNSYQYIERIHDYKNFEYKLYEPLKEKIQSVFSFSTRLVLGNKKVGICSLDSSWRCYGDTDFGNILIGEEQLNNNYKFIKDCDIKIATVHHQLEWLSEVEKRTITSHFAKNFDVVLSGHVHEHNANMQAGFTGNCFYNVSPSGLNNIRSESTIHVNGFTVIDYNNSVTCYFFKYNHNQKKFVDNTDIIDKGFITFPKPVIENEDNKEIYEVAIENIKEDHFEKIDKHFLDNASVGETASAKSCFVLPPIDTGNNYYDENLKNTGFSEIVRGPQSLLILGSQESGKTSLLYRLLVEYIDDFELYSKIPVYIDFPEIKNKEFITLIKEFTRLSTQNVKGLIENKKIILLIDNLSFHEARNFNDQINRLHAFNRANPEIRIIATYEHESLGILPTEIISHCKIGFQYQFIRGLKSKEIKQIMKRWLPSDDVQQTDEKLEKLVQTFSSYHLPNTAMSVNLYLWSLENSDKKPINHAVLMEIYIELILEKINKENIYRSQFDFKNKIQLIAKIAEYMVVVKENSTIIKYEEFRHVIDDYLRNKVGFDFSTDVIVDYLFGRKIFVKIHGDEVKFSHLCFFHFFVAKRMEDNVQFKNYILDESRYFNFPKEIDYYTGLIRSDQETFEIIFKRFKALFDPLNSLFDTVNPDEYFNVKIKKKEEVGDIEPLARNIEIAKIKDSRPTEAEEEKIYDEQLEKLSNQRQEKKDKEKVNFDTMLLIMCNVLRNSEGIEDLKLKNEAYELIIKHNITYSILYTQLVVRYIVENKKLPPSIPPNTSLEVILNYMPLNIQYALSTHLGTQKLSSVILEKIRRDSHAKQENCSEVEKFLSVGLYSDIQGQNFDNYLRAFIKEIDSVPVQNYMFIKLMRYFYKRSKEGSENEAMYLDLISELKIRTKKMHKSQKTNFIEQLKDKKSKIVKYIGFNK